MKDTRRVIYPWLQHDSQKSGASLMITIPSNFFRMAKNFDSVSGNGNPDDSADHCLNRRIRLCT
jgi:hypothetical protein